MLIGLASGLGSTTSSPATSSGPAFDPDAQAFISAVGVAGGSLTSTEQNAVNTLVIDLKAGGVWSKLTRIYPMTGASAAAFSINLKTPGTNNLVFAGGSNTYNAAGFTVGTGGGASTGVLADSLSVSDHSFGVYNSVGVSGSFTTLMGAESSTHYLIDPNNGQMFYRAGNILGVQATAPRIGFHTVQCAPNVSYWRNGSLVHSSGSPATSFQPRVFRVGAATNGYDAQVSSGVGAVISFAFIGLLMDSTQMTAFYSAVNSFQSSLLRNV